MLSPQAQNVLTFWFGSLEVPERCTVCGAKFGLAKILSSIVPFTIATELGVI